MYTLRCAPCYQQKEVLQEYDNEIRDGLEKILNVELEDKSWQQCSLPMRKGGLGTRKATDLALPAFLFLANATVAEVEHLLPDNMVDQDYTELVEAETLWGEIIPGNVLQPSNKILQAE